MITDCQVALLRQRRMEGKTHETTAAMAGMSVRSARKLQRGPLPSTTKQERRWRTRPDPFDGVWEEEIEPLLRGDPAGKLKATTIIEWLAEHHPGRFSASQLRTLQRRLQDWRALNGPDQEVYFPQEYPPGREAQIDFTHSNSLGVIIASQPLPTHAVPADTHLFGVALRRGRHQQDLPGVAAGYPVRPVDTGRGPPGGTQRQYLRRNSQGAPQPRPRAQRRLRSPAGPLRPPFHPHQSRPRATNGVAEQGHYRLKDAIDQALILRASREGVPTLAMIGPSKRAARASPSASLSMMRMGVLVLLGVTWSSSAARL